MKDSIGKLNGMLEQVQKMVESWQNSSLGELERDVVLEQLREVYTLVKRLECGAEVEAEVEAEAVPTPKQPAEVIEESIAEPEREVVRRMSRRSILSLYGVEGGEEEELEIPEDIFSDDVLTEEPSEEEAPQEDAPLEEEPAPVVQPIAEEPIAEQPTQPAQPAERAHTEPERKIQNDVMAGSGHTLGDTYARLGTATDMAAKISAGTVTELRKAIGINDRFLMIKEIFGGNEGAYTEAISDLERFLDLDEAMLHIHDKYNWNPNNEGVKLLMELLTKKLS